jgi:colanic acid biosynthesis glycosyl transferase WcaI
MSEPSVKPLSILIYGLNYAPELTGVGRYTGEIGQYLSADGHKIRVVTAPPHYPGWTVKPPYAAWRYGSEFIDGATIIRCPILLRKKMHGIWRLLAPLSFALSSAPVVIWAILRHQPDIVFCVEPTLFAAPAALIAAESVKARKILHVQDLEIDAAFAVGHLKSHMAQTIAGFFERRVLRHFDQIIAISNKMRERLVAKGVRPERLSMVRNWVDLDEIRPLTGPNRFRSELGLSQETFVILYAGSIGAKQALHVVLDAAEKLADKMGFAFVVAGDGPDKPRLVAKYGHLPNVYFLPLQPEDRLCELLNFADLHVLPQDKGIADLVLPSKLGGMLASGKPVLATADKETELFEVLNGTALIVPAGDSAAMASEILKLARQGCDPSLKDGRALAQIFCRQTSLQDLQVNVISRPSATNDKPIMTLDIWHNLLWSRYKGSVFSKVHELAIKNSIAVNFFQIAEVSTDRVGLAPVDLDWHQYPYDLLFKGSYANIPAWNLYWQIAKRTWRSKADIAILTGYEHPETWLQVIINLIRRKKSAVWGDSTIYDKKQTVLKGILKRIFFYLCDGIFCYGQRAADYARFYGAGPEKIFTRCQAAALFEDYDAGAILQRRIAERETQQVCYLYVGRLSPEKCIDDLIGAFALVLKTRPDARLAIVGTGPHEQGLRTLARQLGVDSSIDFIGARFDEGLVEEYLKATCLVLPSRSEPWGLVVNEALSCGCPVVVSERCGCVPELVVEGKTGFAFPCGNREDLADKLTRVPEVFADSAATARICIEHIAPFNADEAARNILDGCLAMLGRDRRIT